MTTIAYKDGVLAGDHAVSIGETIIISNTPKVVRREDGEMCAVTGSLTFGTAFLEWFLDGEKGARPNGKHENGNSSADRGIIIRKTGKIECYEFGDPWPAIIEAEYYAMGSGRDMALGAMSRGATAQEAVDSAIKHDAYSRYPITVVRMET